MNITLYNNISDNRVVNKTLTTFGTYNIQMRDEFNVRGDTLELDIDGEYVNLFNPDTVIDSRYLISSGTLAANANYYTSDYMEVNGTYILEYKIKPGYEEVTWSIYIGYYDTNKGWIERKAYASNNIPYTITHTGFIRISFRRELIVARSTINIYKKTLDLSKINYCYIDDLQRYYYIKEVNAKRFGLWQLSLKCDVLMTFASGIRALNGTVDRQQNKYNGYIPDGEYKQLAYSQITAKAFPNAMNNDTLILMTVG